MELFYVLTDPTITSICSDPDLKTVWNIVNLIVKFILLGIPILLVIFGLTDLAKAVMAGKDEEIKASQKLLIKRVAYTVAAFLFLIIVAGILTLIADDTANEAVKCLKEILHF